MKSIVFVACHKKYEVPEDDLYLPVFVGSAGKEDIGFQRDDTGENISRKNPMYSELTGLYWCWKNLDYDILGLTHYRRYFTLKTRSEQKKMGPLNSVLTSAECDNLMKRYRVIVPKKRNYYIETIYSHYCHTFDGSQLDLTKEILREQHPEYIPAFEQVMRSRKAYIFNMFIMDKELVSEYCAWLFPILEELEKRYDTAGLTDFEKRYSARISERLFNVWLTYKTDTGEIKRSDIQEVPYLYLGKVDWWRKGTSFLMARFFHKKYDRSF